MHKNWTLTSQSDRGALLIGTGLTIILAAQLFPRIPVAAAFALIGWGATRVMCQQPETRHQKWRLCGSLLVYGALVGLAVGAELDLRFNTIFVADALLAVLLLLSAVHSVFHRTDSSSTW